MSLLHFGIESPLNNELLLALNLGDSFSEQLVHHLINFGFCIQDLLPGVQVNLIVWVVLVHIAFDEQVTRCFILGLLLQCLEELVVG